KPLINHVFGRMDSEPVLFLPTPVIFSREIVEHFWQHLRDIGLTFSDLISYSPWEAIWYGLYAFSRFRERLHPIQPLAIHFASDEHIAHVKAIGVTRETLAKNFLAITLAARHQ